MINYIHKPGKIGFVRCTDKPRTKPYRVRIYENGERRTIGYFSSKKAARKAYLDAIRERNLNYEYEGYE